MNKKSGEIEINKASGDGADLKQEFLDLIGSLNRAFDKLVKPEKDPAEKPV